MKKIEAVIEILHALIIGAMLIAALVFNLIFHPRATISMLFPKK